MYIYIYIYMCYYTILTTMFQTKACELLNLHQADPKQQNGHTVEQKPHSSWLTILSATACWRCRQGKSGGTFDGAPLKRERVSGLVETSPFETRKGVRFGLKRGLKGGSNPPLNQTWNHFGFQVSPPPLSWKAVLRPRLQPRPHAASRPKEQTGRFVCVYMYIFVCVCIFVYVKPSEIQTLSRRTGRTRQEFIHHHQ